LEIVKNFERLYQREREKEKRGRKNDHWVLFLSEENVLFHSQWKDHLQLRIHE